MVIKTIVRSLATVVLKLSNNFALKIKKRGNGREPTASPKAEPSYHKRKQKRLKL